MNLLPVFDLITNQPQFVPHRYVDFRQGNDLNTAIKAQ